MKYQIINGHSAEVLKTFPDNHFDSIVTDPPYLIGFLGKEWDAKDNFQLDVYKECLRVLKPGGHILAFSAARTYHHLAITLEQAGFEIRDQIMWIYSSGFPKSQDIGRSIQRSLGVKETKRINATQSRNKEGLVAPDINNAGYEDHYDVVTVTDPEAKAWEGWGTALKPAHEPIALARKPIKGSIKDNVLKLGVGALNIDATRVPITDEGWKHSVNEGRKLDTYGDASGYSNVLPMNEAGRFPANVLGEIAEPYQKYFYCPKVSRKERHIGYDTSTIPTDPSGKFDRTEDQRLNANERIENKGGNNHPTVKPIELMKYLIKLITPAGGKVLDPFNGSGSTGCAAVELGCEYVGIELDAAYVEIANKRIEAWNKQDTTFNELFE